MSTPTETVEATIRQYMDDFQRMDPVAMLNAYSDDAVIQSLFHESGSTELSDIRRYEGRAEIEAYFSTITLFRQLRFVDMVYRPTADGKSVYIEARGDSIMADGTKYQNRFVFRFDVQDGRIVHLDEWVNPITASRAFKRTLPPA